jgi:hypothetical protein
LVRETGYTWEQVMSEKLPRTLYSLEQLQEEAEKKKKKQEKMKRQANKAKSKT